MVFTPVLEKNPIKLRAFSFTPNLAMFLLRRTANFYGAHSPADSEISLILSISPDYTYTCFHTSPGSDGPALSGKRDMWQGPGATCSTAVQIKLFFTWIQSPWTWVSSRLRHSDPFPSWLCNVSPFLPRRATI